MVFGDIYSKIKDFLTECLGSFGGLYALYCVLSSLWEKLSCGDTKKTPVMLINRRNYLQQKRLQQSNLDCDDYEDRDFRLSYNNELFTYNNELFQPPYNYGYDDNN